MLQSSGGFYSSSLLTLWVSSSGCLFFAIAVLIAAPDSAPYLPTSGLFSLLDCLSITLYSAPDPAPLVLPVSTPAQLLCSSLSLSF